MIEEVNLHHMNSLNNYKENGIAPTVWTAPYSPQQNELVEREIVQCYQTTRKGVDNENTTPVNIEINDNIDNPYQEQDPINDPNSPITPSPYTYNPHSEEEATTSSTKNSGNIFDHVPVRGFKDLAEIYQSTQEVETETLLFTEEEEPRNYKEASTDKKWIEAMEIELDSINKNNTWTLTTLPPDQKAIGLKWVYKTKRDAKGKIIKYKARLVAKGYVQEQGIDFDEVFAPVARIETVRLILALAAYHGWQVHHLDVKSAFLHGELKEEVYVTQPEGFVQQGNSGKVYKLIKALYGLRQAPRAWNVKLDQTLKLLNFKKCNLEQAVYTRRSKTSTLIVGVYVDDLIITGTPRKEIDVFNPRIRIDLNDRLSLLAYYLGIEVTQTGGEITIKQTGYINKILKETSMTDSNDTKIPMDPGTKLVKAEDGNSVDATYYRSLIGSLRPEESSPEGGKASNPIYQRNKGACQALWLKRLLSELTGWEEKRVTLKVDNISAIALVRNPVFHGRSKHIDIRYHFIRECVENGHINVEHVSGELQRADILTKALPRLKYTLGGFDGEKYVPAVECFDTRMGSWVEAEPMNISRGNFGAFVLDEKLYTIGGVKENEVVMDIVECFKEGSCWEIVDLKAIGKRSHFSAIVA
ncbi:ribonuclease H-like domain, reverse transcriptase, RNA-dependent DNA polymerase [Tanacetum coccineum]